MPDNKWVVERTQLTAPSGTISLRRSGTISEILWQANLLQVLVEQISELVFRGKTDQLSNYITVGVQQVELRLVLETERALESIGVRVVGIKVGELDFA